MLIRRANIKDARRISYLIQQNTEKVKENNYSKEQTEIWKKANTPVKIKHKIASSILFCAFANDRLLGTIGLNRNEVFGLYVSHSQRGKGIGRSLLQHLESYARDQEVTALMLTSTPSAKQFYQKHGFSPLNLVSVEVDGVIFRETKMIKKLP